MPRRPSIAVKKAAEEFTATATKLLSFPAPVKIKNPAAVALGKLGGSKGGRIRAEKLSEGRKKEIAQQAARARWEKEKAKAGR